MNISDFAFGQGSVSRTQTNTLRQAASTAYSDPRSFSSDRVQTPSEGSTSTPVQTNSACRRIKGTFTATNWPGGKIMVGCSGDSGTGGCTGGVTSVSPGGSFDLPLCTCGAFTGGTPGVVNKGCLAIGKNLYLRTPTSSDGRMPILGDTSVPAGCTLVGGNGIACGGNGVTVTANFTISCQASPTPTKVPTPTPTKVPTPTPTKVPTPTPTKVPTPSACPVPPQVLNVKVTCPNCPPSGEGLN